MIGLGAYLEGEFNGSIQDATYIGFTIQLLSTMDNLVYNWVGFHPQNIPSTTRKPVLFSDSRIRTAQGFKPVPMKLKWQDELTSKNRGIWGPWGGLGSRGPWNPQPTNRLQFTKTYLAHG